MKSFKFGFWSKLIGICLLLVASTFLWLTWSIYFPPDYEEIIPIRLEGNGVSREFRVKRGLIDIQGHGSDVHCCDREQSSIILDVTYPDARRPASWNEGQKSGQKTIKIIIRPIYKNGTMTESMVKRSAENGHISTIAPGFPMFKGSQDGYDIYDELPSLKIKTHNRSLVFKDSQGELVGVGVRLGTESVMFGNLVIYYAANSQPWDSNFFLKDYRLQTTDEISNPNKPSHREMRDWVESVVRSILVDTHTYPRTERAIETYRSNKPANEK